MTAALTMVLAALAGAGVVAAEDADLQRSASSVRPDPASARADRGRLAADGCMVEQQTLRFPTCVYGRRSSPRTVVLFGDSQAMQWFPPLARLARRHGWRLVGRTRAGCVPADVRFSHRCDRWREGTLARIERDDRPALVVTASGGAYRIVRAGRRLSSQASQRHLRSGYARTLRRLRRTGARLAVIKTQTWAPGDVVGCVAHSLGHLRRCAFAREQPTDREFEAGAARDVRGTRLVDPRERICLPRICPAVIDDMLVYRDRKHLSATFARTLADWLDARLPRPR